MDREERQKIYTLLAQFYPKAKQLQSRETLTAWGMALARYDYEAVKASALDYAAKSRFFPNLSDLTAGLTPAAAPEQEEKNPRGVNRVLPGMKKYIEKLMEETK